MLVGCLLLLSGCSGGTSTPPGQEGRLRAVTSISVLADLIRNVGGEQVEVVSLVPPGADVHGFQPSPADGVAIHGADIIFYNGLGLEAALDSLTRSSARQGVPLVVLSQGVDAGQGSPPGGPHLWLDVRNAMRYVETIRDALVKLDPGNADGYRSSAAAYLDRLEALDHEMEAAIQSIPPQRRLLVTFHDAFSHMAHRYGLEVVAFVLRAAGSEPSARDVADLARRIEATGVPTVYKEPQFNARVLEQVARDSGVAVRVLYSDALDQEARTYIEMMRFDMRSLVEGLRSR